MSYCVTLSPNGDITIQPFPPETEDGNLKFLQSEVDGYIERVGVNCGSFPLDMWVNEEGLLVGLEPNELASYIADKNYHSYSAYIVGNAVITGSNGPNTRGLTLDEVKAISDTAHDFADLHGLAVTVED